MKHVWRAGATGFLILTGLTVGMGPDEVYGQDCAFPELPYAADVCENPRLRAKGVLLQNRLRTATEELSPSRASQMQAEQKQWTSEIAERCQSNDYRGQRRYCLSRALDGRMEHVRRVWTTRLFPITDVQVNSDRELTRVCFPLNASIDRQQDAALESYVAVKPALPFSARARGREFCVEGLPHGGRFDIAIRTGIRAEGGRYVIRQPIRQNVEIPHRPATVRFAASGRVLPRLDASGLPLETVNISRLKVSVFRVNDRVLAAKLQNGQISLPMSFAQLGRLMTGAADNVWQGEMDTSGPANRARKTALPLKSTLGQLRAGMYLAVASPAEESASDDHGYWVAAQWFNVSDINLTVYRGQDSLDVQARSQHSAQPLKDIRLELKSRDGRELFRGQTDVRGWIGIPPGFLRGEQKAAPATLFAYGKDGDFVAMDLARGEIDLHRRGSRGRAQPGALDAFMATERGIYRPGDLVHMTAILRDARSVAVPDLPLLLTIRRADGAQVYQKAVQPGGGGSYLKRLKLPANASTGTWLMDLRTRKEASPIGRVSFQVEDFVPPQIEVDMDATLDREGDGPARVLAGVNANYLYGAPAPGLKGELRAILRPAKRIGEGLDGFQFGNVKEDAPSSVRLPLKPFSTGKDGTAVTDLPLSPLPKTLYPMELVVRATVFERGGRPLSRSRIVPVELLPVRIGIRPQFTGDYLATGRDGGFEIVALDQKGKPVSRRLAARIIREDVDHIWYRSGGYWNVRRFHSDESTIIDVPIETKADEFVSVAMPGQEWGSYRVEVTDTETGISASTRFHVGWGGAQAGATRSPDKVLLTVAPGDHKPGDEIEVHVSSPFAGEIELAVAGQKLLKSKSVTVGENGKVVRIKLPDEIVAGVYVLANAYAPPDGIRSRIGRRAVGLTWVPLDKSDTALQLELTAPEEIEPGGQMTVNVRTNAQSGEDVYLVLAAVDDAVLQLTGFGAPDPVKHYLGRRQLGLRLSDIYSQLIDSAGYAAGTVRSGGDAVAGGNNSAQLRNLPKKNQPVMVLHSGLVQADEAGLASIPMALPEFNGRLRLMAMAWSGQRVGKGTGQVIVRRPVIAQLPLPRFLAPGDKAELGLSVANISGPGGAYRAEVSTSGPLIADPASPFLFEAEPGDAALSFPVRLTATGPGEGKVSLTVKGPEGYATRQDWHLTVRSGNAVVTNRFSAMLQPGEKLIADPSLHEGLLPGSAETSIAVDLLPDLDLPGVLNGLARYPYGCAEQTVSTALPHLFVPSLNADLGIVPTGRDSRRAVMVAIDRMVAMQMRDGQFGLWSARHAALPWVSAYVTDFLISAKSAGAEVPDHALKKALGFMRKLVQAPDEDPHKLAARAYAHYNLAQAGIGNTGLLRRFYAVSYAVLPRGLARAHVAAALARTGDRETARAAFAKTWPEGVSDAGDTFGVGWYDYGSPLRDRTAVLTLMAESGIVAWSELWRLGQQVSEHVLDRRYLSTQEQGWIVRLANALMQRPTGAAMVQVADAQVELASGRPYFAALPHQAGQAELPILENTGDEAIRASVTVVGQKAGTQPAIAEGMEIRRALLDENGKPVDPVKLRQNQLVIVRLTGQLLRPVRSRALIVDYLPAGLELENPATGGVGVGEFEWLDPGSKPDHRELRDDRFVAALELDNRKSVKRGRFSISYVARAVTPGRFAFGNAIVEDMYRPSLRGLTSVAEVAIAP